MTSAHRGRRVWVASLVGGWVGATILLAGPRAAAHPYHLTTTTVDVRKDRLEVTVVVAPEDLQEALRRAAGRPVDIDKASDLDRLARAYIEARFVVTHGDKTCKLRWVGSEVETDAARLFFEFDLREAPASYRLVNRIFFDIAPAQVNRVQVRHGTRRHTLRFQRGTAPLVLLPRS